jgi:hypothetical protein
VNPADRTLELVSTWAARAGVALMVAAFVALAALWAWDRSRPRETPRFEPGRFVSLDATATPPGPGGRWLVAVHPACPRCREDFPRTAAAALRQGPPPNLEVLYVDAPVRPTRDTRAAFARLGATAHWWDSAGVWRGRWRHRVYGETLRFAADGTLLGVDPPPARGTRPDS